MITRRYLVAGLAGAALTRAARAVEPPVRPALNPIAISLWTSAALARGLQQLLERFEQAQGIRVNVTARGSDVAMAALYTGHADIALLGRPATDTERQAFEWVRQYPAAEMILSAMLPGASPPVTVIVNHGNPIAFLTMAQLRRLLIAQQPLSWRDLGVGGTVGPRDVRVHMPYADSGTGRFLRATLADGRSQLSWRRIVEHDGDAAAMAISKAVAHDPTAIGLTGISSPGVRFVAINSEGKLLTPADADYPLRRPPYLYLECPLIDARPAVHALAAYLSQAPR